MYLAKTKAQSAARLPHSWSATLFSHLQKTGFLMMWLICYCRVLNDKGEDIELFSSIECKVSTRAQSLFSKIHHPALSSLCLQPKHYAGLDKLLLQTKNPYFTGELLFKLFCVVNITHIVTLRSMDINGYANYKLGSLWCE